MSDSPILDMLAWGSLGAVVLGFLVPVVLAGLLKSFTRVDTAVICVIAITLSVLVLVPATLALAGLALWLGPLALVVVCGGVFLTLATVASVCVVAQLPRV